MRNFYISETQLKENTIIDENVDVKVIADTIDLCQDKYITPLIGTALDNELQTQVGANTVTSDNTTLLVYIQNALKYWVLYEGVDIFTYKFRNKSVMKMNSENSNSIDTEEIRRLMEIIRSGALSWSLTCFRHRLM